MKSDISRPGPTTPPHDSYEVTKQQQKVDPISGKLIERNI
jgi:hypothetical protein